MLGDLAAEPSMSLGNIPELFVFSAISQQHQELKSICPAVHIRQPSFHNAHLLCHSS